MYVKVVVGEFASDGGAEFQPQVVGDIRGKGSMVAMELVSDRASKTPAADLAKQLIETTIEKQDVRSEQLILHSDRGPSMTSHSVAQLLGSLGVTKSHSRPHVSNDNPFSESQFKTMKYRPEFPKRFGCYEDASHFCRQFFDWYNNDHYHTGLNLMTPAMVHYGLAETVRDQRNQVLQAAYLAHPERFVRGVPTVPDLPPEVWINQPAGTPLIADSAQ